MTSLLFKGCRKADPPCTREEVGLWLDSYGGSCEADAKDDSKELRRIAISRFNAYLKRGLIPRGKSKIPDGEREFYWALKAEREAAERKALYGNLDATVATETHTNGSGATISPQLDLDTIDTSWMTMEDFDAKPFGPLTGPKLEIVREGDPPMKEKTDD